MRITLSIDDDLLAKVRAMTGLENVSEIARAGLKALVERESGLRLAPIGGIAPDFEVPPRKRSTE